MSLRARLRRLWCVTFHENRRRVLWNTRAYGQLVRCHACEREWWEA